MPFSWLEDKVKTIEQTHLDDAHAHQAQLTKPPGSLGRLEELAVRLSAMQQSNKPKLQRIRIVVFAADHGVAEEKVSAFPQVVTTEMVRNFARGGAAISVLARQLDAEMEVIDLGSVVAPGELAGVLSQRIAPGSRNFCKEPAMTEAQCAQALQAGRDSVLRAVEQGADLFIGGEMGIANTTVAAAVAAAILKRPAADLVGPGTGVDAEGVAHKAQVVDKALQQHTDDMNSVLAILRCVGGFEIAALSGAYLAAAQHGLPVLIDGFISSVAALVTRQLQQEASQWFFYSHQSAEPGHRLIMQALEAKPLLDLNMRLGEGSGAAVAACLLRSACALHSEMSTFAEAGVSSGD